MREDALRVRYPNVLLELNPQEKRGIRSDPKSVEERRGAQRKMRRRHACLALVTAASVHSLQLELPGLRAYRDAAAACAAVDRHTTCRYTKVFRKSSLGGYSEKMFFRELDDWQLCRTSCSSPQKWMMFLILVPPILCNTSHEACCTPRSCIYWSDGLQP